MTGDGQKFQLLTLFLKQTNEIFLKCNGMLALSPVAKYIGLISIYKEEEAENPWKT